MVMTIGKWANGSYDISPVTPAEWMSEMAEQTSPLIPSSEPGAVLVVEDDIINRTLLAASVERMGRTVLFAQNGEQALDLLVRKKCDLVLLDVMLPELDGRELLAHIKQHDEWRSIPVIVISGMGEAQTAAWCIEVGAEDYLTKPYNPLLLQARIAASIEKKRLRDQEADYYYQLLTLQDRLDRRNRELEELNTLLARAAFTDALTGLPNRRWAMEELQRCWVASARHHAPLTALVLDVDDFKQVNDAVGHAGGDEVLKGVAERLRATVRQHEGVARTGGEEFLVLCETTDTAGAAAAGERFRAAVDAGPIRYGERDLIVTISVGAAVRSDSMTEAGQLLRAADQAMYAAKQAGRNRIVVAPMLG
jgi:two-component system cell cycle response regulator